MRPARRANPGRPTKAEADGGDRRRYYHRRQPDQGIPEYEAKRYEGKVKDGNILLSVHAEDNDERDRAKKILEAGGAEDISYTGEAAVPKERKAPDNR